MRNFVNVVAAICVFAPIGSAQLTVEQRLFDFEHLASIYAKYYAPYEWKRDALGFDLYSIQPWLDRIRASRSDIEYLEIASEYVTSLRDTHSELSIPSNFAAEIGIRADIYDNKVLIETISRTELPVTRYPFQVGDEVVSIDGKSAEDLIRDFSRFATLANPRGTRRLGASYLFFRPQEQLPRAHEVAAEAVVVVRRSNGDLETYSIPWVKRGIPIINLSPIPGPFTATDKQRPAAAWGTGDYRDFMRRIQTRMTPQRGRITGWGARAPWFALPQNFTLRLGRSSADFHYSGTYEANGKRIGYLRIPSFDPPSPFGAVRELQTEVEFLQANTDGLVVDITRNPGGNCYGEFALQLLIPYNFRAIADEIRPNLELIISGELALETAELLGAEDWEIEFLRIFVRDLRQAYSENRGRSGPLSTCGVTNELSPAKDGDRVIAYSKPLITLIDELTVSWGDVFAAVMADSARGPLVGYRTDGAGGLVDGRNAGFYSETFASYSLSLGTRKQPTSTPGYPTTSYIENVGVHPDIVVDAMNGENLRTRGRPFVDAFTAAVLEEIERKQ